MSDKFKTITINLSKECYAKLEEQLSFLKGSTLSEFSKVITVEQLVERYLEQLTSPNQKFEEIQEKIQEMMKVFSSKGLDISEILNSFSEKVFEKEKKGNSKKNSSDKKS